MSSIKNLSQLESEKHFLREKISRVESKQKELSEILKKKTLEKTRTLGSKAIDPYNTVSIDGKPLSEYRPPRATNNAALALPPLHKEMVKALPFRESSDVAKLRIQNIKRQIDHKSSSKGAVDIFANRRNTLNTNPTSSSSSKVPASLFPNRYKRGELPCSIEHGTAGQYLSWVCPLEKLDYEHYLPLFFDGLQCKGEPLAFLACQGVKDLLQAARGSPERVLPCVPLIVTPIRHVLCKRDPAVLLPLLQCLRELVRVGDGVGETLINSDVRFLALMNVFVDHTRNTGDAIDYGQHRNDDVGVEVIRTLEEFERHGGKHAFRRIKFSIPTYESCV